MPGEIDPIVHTISLPIAMVLAGFFAIAMYNCIEIYISILHTFRHWRGLYFWSCLSANTGIPLVALSTLLRFFDLAAGEPMSIFYILGWWLMVTGQAFVLYSRMHLVVHDPAKLLCLLRMIIAVFVMVQLPTSGVFVFINYKRNPGAGAIKAFDIFEKLQLTVFAVQETILSGMYVYESSKTLKPLVITKGPRVLRLFHEFVGLFIVVVALDLSLGKYSL